MYKKAISIIAIIFLAFSIYSFNTKISKVSRILYDLGCNQKDVNEGIFKKFIFYSGYWDTHKGVISLNSSKIDIKNLFKYSPYKDQIINIVMSYIQYIIESKEFEIYYQKAIDDYRHLKIKLSIENPHNPHFTYNQIEFNNKYPQSSKLFIKKRLKYLLNETKDVDYYASLKGHRPEHLKWIDSVYGGDHSEERYFVKKEYENKSDIWKTAYRAGKEIVLPIRKYVKKWLRNFNSEYDNNYYTNKNILVRNENIILDDFDEKCEYVGLDSDKIIITPTNSDRNITLSFTIWICQNIDDNLFESEDFDLLELKFKKKINSLSFYFQNHTINELNKLKPKFIEIFKPIFVEFVKRESNFNSLSCNIDYIVRYNKNPFDNNVTKYIKTIFRGKRFNSKYFSTKPGCPILLEAKLERDERLYRDISGEKIYFQIKINEDWQVIEDDITITNQITDKSEDKGLGSGGIARVYYIPPDNLLPGKYDIKAIYKGSGKFEQTEKLAILTINPSETKKPFIVKKHSVGVGIPLILVHGNRAEQKTKYCLWETLVKYVNKYSYKFSKFDIYIWKHDTDLPIGFNGYTGNAKELAICLKQYILSKYPSGTKTIFVAHSRGGLVCRSFMNYKNQGDNILGLITLGTPHHGSPGAVADWSAIIWKNYGIKITGNGSKSIFDNFVCTNNKGPYDWDRIGDINLAWDNMDGAIASNEPLTYYYDVKFSPNKRICLSKQDLNCFFTWHDCTTIYSNQYKFMFGILIELNQNEKYLQKIITYAAYDNNLSDNASKYILHFSNHKNLEVANKILAYASGDYKNKIVNNNSVYYANDGFVPIQSALFLDISNGMPFCYAKRSLSGKINQVKLLFDNIINRQKVKDIRIFSNDDLINDHLDLLDTPIDNEKYWGTLANDINGFIDLKENAIKDNNIDKKFKLFWYEFVKAVNTKNERKLKSLMNNKVFNLESLKFPSFSNILHLSHILRYDDEIKKAKFKSEVITYNSGIYGNNVCEKKIILKNTSDFIDEYPIFSNKLNLKRETPIYFFIIEYGKKPYSKGPYNQYCEGAYHFEIVFALFNDQFKIIAWAQSG